MRALVPKSYLLVILFCFSLTGYCSLTCVKNVTAQDRPQLPLYPVDVAAADDGTIYAVDRNLPGIWKWKDGELSVFFQGSPKYRTPLNAPRCVAIGKDGEVLVGDTATRDVYRVTQGKAEPITGGKIGIPMDLAVAKDGTVFVADLELRRLFRIPAGTGDVEEVAEINPRGVGLDADGNVWVISQDSAQLQKLDSEGKAKPVVSERTFQFPHQIAIDSAGTAYITDGYAKAIWKIEKGGKPEQVVSGEPLQNPIGITLHENKPLVVDSKARKVFRLTDGKLEEVFEIKR
ncbi:MAG: NHL repeat-containing protein [Planctomycetota bacterium]